MPFWPHVSGIQSSITPIDLEKSVATMPGKPGLSNLHSRHFSQDKGGGTVLNLPTEATPLVVILSRVPHLRPGLSENFHQLKNKVVNCLSVHAYVPHHIWSEIIMVRRVRICQRGIALLSILGVHFSQGKSMLL